MAIPCIPLRIRIIFMLSSATAWAADEEAALVSRIACQFFKHLLSCGASLETVLGTVNDFLLHQSCECSTTLDMVRFDLLDGQCDFIKCGACPSLVLRGDNTFKISSTSLPVGATREVHYEKVTVRLRPGDKIILISDGISSQIEGSPWLSALSPAVYAPTLRGWQRTFCALLLQVRKNRTTAVCWFWRFQSAEERLFHLWLPLLKGSRLFAPPVSGYTKRRTGHRSH